MEMKLCECGCGNSMPAIDNKNRTRRFIYGHQNSGKRSSAQNEQSKQNMAQLKRLPRWNVGKTYVFKKKTVYANEGSLAKAMKRLFPNECMRCFWKEGSCDIHHIQKQSDGGLHTLSNSIILCPNCHRLAHESKISFNDLVTIRANARQVAEAV